MMNHIRVSVVHQALYLSDGGEERSYPISTAANGVGCEAGSFQTPRGLHRVRLKIGEGCPPQTVFVRRRPTGEVFSQELRDRWPNRDWILSRILWLDGLVVGLNRRGSVDTLRRHIYIHGTADEHRLGEPVSHGCIRMGNSDVIDLCSRISIGCLVTVEG
jgi:lipoprotein-anchoring transpeptidase ErfK/SrfK